MVIFAHQLRLPESLFTCRTSHLTAVKHHTHFRTAGYRRVAGGIVNQREISHRLYYVRASVIRALIEAISRFDLLASR